MWRVIDTSAPAVFADLKTAFSARGDVVTQAKTRDVLRVECAGQTYYIKRYWTAGKGLRAYCFRSRVRAEWENIEYFRRLGLSTPELVAYGESRSFWHYEQGAFVMRALPGVAPLDEVLKDTSLSPTIRLSFLRQIAEGLRRLHDDHFVHGDCFIRNFLVSLADSTVYFTDCPRGRHLRGPFLEYGRRRDLERFDKEAQWLLTPTERTQFYEWYRLSE